MVPPNPPFFNKNFGSSIIGVITAKNRVIVVGSYTGPPSHSYTHTFEARRVIKGHKYVYVSVCVFVCLFAGMKWQAETKESK